MPSESKSAGKAARKRRPTAKVVQSKAQLTESDEDVPAAKAMSKSKASVSSRVNWNKDMSRTERLLDYLEGNPDLRHKLFSDSTQNAKEENCQKAVSKTAKGPLYGKIAEAVFSVDGDAETRTDYAANPAKYTKAVDNYINR